MEQHQSRVRFSLRTKLLLSVVSLLFVVISFLTLATYYLFTEDKRAYVYQTQATETQLAGKEFTFLVDRSLDTLRQVLGSVDPKKSPGAKETRAIHTILENQSQVAGVLIESIDWNTDQFKTVLAVNNEAILKTASLNASDLEIKGQWLKLGRSELETKKFAFFNLSKVGSTPLLAVGLLDQKLLAVGFLPLNQTMKDFSGSQISVATSTGWILFDTDPSLLYGQKTINEDPLFRQAATGKTASGAMEYQVSHTAFLGSYFRPAYELVVLSRTEWKKAMRATYSLTEKFLLMGLLAIGVAVIFSIVFARSLTAPLNRLYEATKAVAEGNFDLSVSTGSSDEIGALSSSFNVMSHKISELIVESVQKARIEGELKIASTVQQTLFPPEHFKDDLIEIASHYEAASECGGDWWSFFTVGKKTVLIIADATGHGIPSALMTAAARSCFSVMQRLAEEYENFSLTPSELLTYANRVIFDSASGKIMMTFFVGVYDSQTRVLSYASAGHTPAWLYKKGEGDTYIQKSLVSKGIRLGETSDLKAFDEKTVTIDKGDILFLYTDGILEGKNLNGMPFGKKSVKSVVEASLAAGPEQVVRSLVQNFRQHSTGKSLDDDITLAVTLFLK